MSKIYMIGEKNGQKFVGHMTKRDAAMFDNNMKITKAEYRRHRAAGIPSWGERVTAIAKQESSDPKRARRWAARQAKAKAEARKMEMERKHAWKERRAKAEVERAQATA